MPEEGVIYNDIKEKMPIHKDIKIQEFSGGPKVTRANSFEADGFVSWVLKWVAWVSRRLIWRLKVVVMGP